MYNRLLEARNQQRRLEMTVTNPNASVLYCVLQHMYLATETSGSLPSAQRRRRISFM